MAQTNYVTLAQVKAQLGLSDTTQDSFLNDTIRRVMGFIDGRTGRRFGAQANATPPDFQVLAEIHDGFSNNTVSLRNMDIRSVDQVRLGAPNTTPQVLPTTSYLIDLPTGRLILGGFYNFNVQNSQAFYQNNFMGAISAGYQTISIDYTYGRTDVPADIEFVCQDIVCYIYLTRQSAGTQMEQIGDYRIMHDHTMRQFMIHNPDLLDVINSYRRRRV